MGLKVRHALQTHANPINTVSTFIHSEPPINQLSEAAREIARRAADAAKETAQKAGVVAKDITGTIEGVAGDVADATRDVARRAADSARESYQSAVLKAGDTLATSKDYVRRNPVPVVLGAVAFGAALGYLLVMARRKPTFRERYSDEPLMAVREAILGAFAPAAQRVHEGYDSVRDGAGKAIERVHGFGTGRAGDSVADQLGRIGNHLKFW
jgi:ElaB/YqjD/DUF883 family membrane-anchored ribosome-binding protein